MHRFFILLYSFIICVFNMNPLIGNDFKSKQDAENSLRILDLLPNLVIPLAVDPSIPADFVALSPSGTLDPYDWIYWGSENSLKDYFADPTSLKTPILRVRLSANVVQTSPTSFDKGTMESLKTMKKQNPKEFSSIETQWGDYPVLAIKSPSQGQLVFMAWVGLNDPEAGWTLLFNLVYPDKKDHPNQEDQLLWNNFITKTTKLKDNDYFKARGQDLQEGYTLVSIGPEKLKIIAEKRQNDGMIQVVIIPENSTEVEFHYVDMMECLMGGQWKYKEPMVKVYAEIVIKKKNFEFTTHYVTSILYKTVSEFSFKKEDEKNLLIFQKISEN